MRPFDDDNNLIMKLTCRLNSQRAGRSCVIAQMHSSATLMQSVTCEDNHHKDDNDDNDDEKDDDDDDGNEKDDDVDRQ